MNFILEHWKDGLEIFILWAGLYWLWVFFRGTRGAKVLTGLAVLFLVMSVLSEFFELKVIGELDVNVCLVQEAKGFSRQKGYLERYHAGLVSVLAERSGAVRWPLAEPLLRELHARHFSQTRQLFRTATRDSNLIWPEELYRNSCEWREFKPFSYLLALSADEAARTGRWEEAIEDTLGVWRFGRHLRCLARTADGQRVLFGPAG